MKIIIPMAGLGKRLRPTTLTVPKPLIPIAGKPIVEWLIERLALITSDEITDIAFIIGNFQFDITNELNSIGAKIKAKVHIFVQDQALGTAHAISFASQLLSGPTIIAFADTLFDTHEKFNSNSDVVIWTKEVTNPELYGVVLKNKQGFISSFVEKPKQFVSNEAIIGIYYFKNAELLKSKIEFILNNNLLENNEYQLTNALQMLLDDGLVFSSHSISEWLDCGNKDLVINTMKYVIQNFSINTKISSNNSVIIPPCYIGENVEIINSVVGPNTSIEDNTKVENSIISNSILLNNSNINSVAIDNSIIGNFVNIISKPLNLSIGDYSEIKI